MVQHSTANAPIRPTMRISELLRDHPELLEVLIAQSPAFEKLRNPVLRRIQSRLVTVEQAARIGGIDPEELIAVLNRAIGVEPEPAAAAPSDAPPEGQEQMADARPAWVQTAPVAVELDAGSYIRRGEEPFSAIMEAAASVPVGSVLRLFNTFEPVPLYAVLGKRGFVSWARSLGPDSWEVLFLNEGRPTRSSSSLPAMEGSRSGEDAGAALAPTATLTIDVSELVPPEPMVKILGALEQLEPGGTLLVHHQRRPIHLYPLLDERGFQHETHEHPDGRVDLLIRKPPTGAPA